MHLLKKPYAQDVTEFGFQIELALTAWMALPVLDSFTVYFTKQWIDYHSGVAIVPERWEHLFTPPIPQEPIILYSTLLGRDILP